MTGPVVCAGIVVMDLIFQVPALPSAATKYFATSCREVAGGIAGNAALAVARLGGAARLVSRVGADGPGRALRAILESGGVDCRFLEKARGATSTSAVCLDPAGERMLVNHVDPAIFDGPPPAAAFNGAAAVMCDLRWPEGARCALEAARAAGIPGVLDFDISPEDGLALLPVASHVIFGEAALRAASGREDLAEGLKALAQAHPEVAFAVTAGAQGAHWLFRGESGHVPARPVTAVDTLGAGDVYHGAAALALAEGAGFAEALRFAGAAAAVKVSRPSGPDSFPTRSDIDNLTETTE